MEPLKCRMASRLLTRPQHWRGDRLSGPVTFDTIQVIGGLFDRSVAHFGSPLGDLLTGQGDRNSSILESSKFT